MGTGEWGVRTRGLAVRVADKNFAYLIVRTKCLASAPLMRILPVAAVLVAFSASLSAADSAKGWSFSEGKGQRDVLFHGKTVLRHMNEWDPARRDETFKPYTHVFDFAGNAPITKGPGGNFTHHRGLFIGWNKTWFGGKSYDFWHCKNVIRRHVKYLSEQEKAEANAATMVSVAEWPAPDGTVVVRETQTITATKPAEGRLQLDVGFKLEAPNGPVKLEGDVQHAGFHFRAAQEVYDRQKQSAYLLPQGAVLKKGDVYEQCNWVVCQFNIGETRYAVAHFNDPKNATPVQYSTRAYGRFGAFSKTEIGAGQTLNLRYRVIVTDTAKVPVGTVADWQKQFDAFAGTATTTAVTR
jgi:hypothetical protein